jgi:hypothetical protein
LPSGVASPRQNLAEGRSPRSILPPESKKFRHKRITPLIRQQEPFKSQGL